MIIKCSVNKATNDDKFLSDKMMNLDTFLMSSPLNNSVYKYTGHVHVLWWNSSNWHDLFYLAEKYICTMSLSCINYLGTVFSISKFENQCDIALKFSRKQNH
jgi:hypothetical protein